MRFEQPLGLLGLIAVPIIILVYILKSKYTEQTITSTYLWTLSDRFLKRKNPMSSLSGILSLILQITVIAVVSLAIARPIFTVNNAALEYCFVLDGSASMNMSDGEATSFERGVDEIEQIIDSSVDGSLYTLIYAGNDASVVFEKLTDKDRALELLKETAPSYSGMDTEDALSTAQRYFDANNSAKVYLVTDKMYQKKQNVTVITVSQRNADNYGISDIVCSLNGETLTANAVLRSYKRDATVHVEMYVDGAKTPSATVACVLNKATDTPVSLSCAAKGYSSVRLAIKENDALSLDNEIIAYNLENNDVYSILLVSDTPFFLEAALDVVGDHTVTVRSTSEYTGKEKAGLYIFHSFTPQSLPKDGAVWFINSSENLADTGFSVRGEAVPEMGVNITMNNSSSTLFKTLAEGLSGEGIAVSKYMKYNTYRSFTTLFSYKENPLIMVGTNGYGNREAVFGFDIHDSNLPLTADFIELIGNLIDFSFPSPIEKTKYFSGEEALVNILPSYDSVKVTAPDGEVSYVSSLNKTGGVILDKVGTYTIDISVSGRSEIYYVYSEVPIDERTLTVIEESVSIAGVAGNEKLKGEYDPITILFIALLVLFTADWMVYMYEKYQLR